jgi:hypothetical protein
VCVWGGGCWKRWQWIQSRIDFFSRLDFDTTVLANPVTQVINGANVLNLCGGTTDGLKVISSSSQVSPFNCIHTHFGFLAQEPILRLWNLQQQRQRCSRLERFYAKAKKIIIKTHHSISCAVNFLQRWRCNSNSWDWVQVKSIILGYVFFNRGMKFYTQGWRYISSHLRMSRVYCHRLSLWRYGSWDRILPGNRVAAFYKNKTAITVHSYS